jgi:predicted phage baseplate assembly protein
MALEDALPVIDDRRYADMVEEIKTRIARYTPEWKPVWNDYNDSDPGITLVQLVAWLGEMMLYRMGKVPLLNYLKFLELLGIEFAAPQGARVDVSFAVQADSTLPYVDLPSRSQVSATADDGGVPLVYETERSLRVLKAELLSVQAFDGTAHTDVTADNAALNPYAPFGALATVDAAIVLGFGSPDFPGTQFDLAVYAASGSGSQPLLACGTPQVAYAPARMQWECWAGSEWQPLDVLRDQTLALSRTGVITLRTPTTAMKRGFLGAYQSDGSKPELFWIRGRLTKAQYTNPPSLLTIRTNTVAALQAQTVRGEVLGGSDGTRNQKWTLANNPVIEGSVKVEIDDGTGAVPWTVRDDLLDAKPDDLVLALAPASGELLAGDGVYGAVPTANAQNPDANVIATEYRYGGGARGNVPAHAVNSLLTAVEGIDGGKVTNLFPAAGGSDGEQLADAEQRARRLVRSQSRAVTVEDFEALAKQAGEVARAKALPLYHPQFPTIPVPGVVSVIILPKAKPIAGRPFTPLPSQGLLRTVCAYLDARRLLTTELYVLAPTYQEIVVSVTVVPTADADSTIVWQGVQDALTRYFDPLTGGDAGAGWGFGDTIRYSKVYQRVFSAPGVDSIEGLSLTLDGMVSHECQDVPIKARGLLYSGSHQVDVTLSSAESAA